MKLEIAWMYIRYEDREGGKYRPVIMLGSIGGSYKVIYCTSQMHRRDDGIVLRKEKYRFLSKDTVVVLDSHKAIQTVSQKEYASAKFLGYIDDDDFKAIQKRLGRCFK